MSASREKGFTLIEIVVIIAIMAVLTSIIVAVFYKLEDNKSLSVDSTSVASLLTDAKSRTLSGENALAYGVHFESGKAVLFVGPTYSSTDPANIVTALSPRDTLTALVTGGGSDVLFSRLTGETASSTITLSLVSSPSVYRIVTVSSLGVVELH